MASSTLRGDSSVSEVDTNRASTNVTRQRMNSIKALLSPRSSSVPPSNRPFHTSIEVKTSTRTPIDPEGQTTGALRKSVATSLGLRISRRGMGANIAKDDFSEEKLPHSNTTPEIVKKANTYVGRSNNLEVVQSQSFDESTKKSKMQNLRSRTKFTRPVNVDTKEMFDAGLETPDQEELVIDDTTFQGGRSDARINSSLRIKGKQINLFMRAGAESDQANTKSNSQVTQHIEMNDPSNHNASSSKAVDDPINRGNDTFQSQLRYSAPISNMSTQTDNKENKVSSKATAQGTKKKMSFFSRKMKETNFEKEREKLLDPRSKSLSTNTATNKENREMSWKNRITKLFLSEDEKDRSSSPLFRTPNNERSNSVQSGTSEVTTANFEILLAKAHLGDKSITLREILLQMYQLPTYLKDDAQESLLDYLTRPEIIKELLHILITDEQPHTPDKNGLYADYSKSSFRLHFVVTALFCNSKPEFRKALLLQEENRDTFFGYFEKPHNLNIHTGQCVIDVLKTLLAEYEELTMEILKTRPNFFQSFLKHTELIGVGEFVQNLITEHSLKTIETLHEIQFLEILSDNFVESVVTFVDAEDSAQENDRIHLLMKNSIEKAYNSASAFLNVSTRIIQIGMSSSMTEASDGYKAAVRGLNVFTYPQPLMRMLDFTISYNESKQLKTLLRIILKVIRNIMYLLIYDSGDVEMLKSESFETLLSQRLPSLINTLSALQHNHDIEGYKKTINDCYLTMFDFFSFCIKMGGPSLVEKIVNHNVPKIMAQSMLDYPQSSILHTIVMNSVKSSLYRNDPTVVKSWISSAKVIKKIIKYWRPKKKRKATIEYYIHLEEIAVAMYNYIKKEADNQSYLKGQDKEEFFNFMETEMLPERAELAKHHESVGGIDRPQRGKPNPKTSGIFSKLKEGNLLEST